MSNPIDLRTPCGVYYTYATNKATGREVLVRHYSLKDIPPKGMYGNRTFKQLLDSYAQRDTCDGYYDWQPMIARIREHIAKIAKGDTNE
tara:strand:- start:141 stop:407 length:267 start_codon:yes stop_codon:yes gene_type:complete